jgi:hypothetical protein
MLLLLRVAKARRRAAYKGFETLRPDGRGPHLAE